jgi:hypothetical protein
MSVAEIMNIIAIDGLHAKNFETLVPEMLRAICKDEHVDAMEEFVKLFDEIEWGWYPNG